MDFILGFTLGALTTGLYAAARIRKLIQASKPRYITPVDDYSRFRTHDQVRQPQRDNGGVHGPPAARGSHRVGQ